MKWITKILDIEPYRVTCQWNNDEIRTVELEKFIQEKSKNPNNSYAQLNDKTRFCEAQCDGSTLYWEDGIIMTDYDGTKKTGPLDIDPDFLYELSFAVSDKLKTNF